MLTQPQPKLNLVYFKRKIWQLVSMISVTFMKNFID